MPHGVSSKPTSGSLSFRTIPLGNVGVSHVFMHEKIFHSDKWPVINHGSITIA